MDSRQRSLAQPDGPLARIQWALAKRGQRLAHALQSGVGRNERWATIDLPALNGRCFTDDSMAHKGRSATVDDRAGMGLQRCRANCPGAGIRDRPRVTDCTGPTQGAGHTGNSSISRDATHRRDAGAVQPQRLPAGQRCQASVQFGTGRARSLSCALDLATWLAMPVAQR